MIVNVDHIKLNGGGGAPEALADAELYLDEAAGLLYVATESGIYGVPLAVIALPPLNGDDTTVLVKTMGGADYVALTGGAGGRPFDELTWRVPGVTPQAVNHQTFAAGVPAYGLFEMSEARTAVKQRVVLASSATVTFGICAWANGAPGAILSTTTATATGVIEDTISLALEPGVYATFFTPTTAISAQVLSAALRNPRFTPGFLGYPVSLSF